eukprot:c3107_g1_i1.p1 GENE.c3107_g1_i1~~c3107_g1_i1.p1  ORF type:complete len:223 (+),score=52.79 c3107_g1_i1:32-700(+)
MDDLALSIFVIGFFILAVFVFLRLKQASHELKTFTTTRDRTTSSSTNNNTYHHRTNATIPTTAPSNTDSETQSLWKSQQKTNTGLQCQNREEFVRSVEVVVEGILLAKDVTDLVSLEVMLIDAEGSLQEMVRAVNVTLREDDAYLAICEARDGAIRQLLAMLDSLRATHKRDAAEIAQLGKSIRKMFMVDPPLKGSNRKSSSSSDVTGAVEMPVLTSHSPEK